MKAVLAVEDTELNIGLISQLLEDDHEPLSARDGLEGMAPACAGIPGLIFMDISLSVADGYEATRKVREARKPTPIIGLSA